jgi:hypothetical protein
MSFCAGIPASILWLRVVPDLTRCLDATSEGPDPGGGAAATLLEVDQGSAVAAAASS